MSSKEATIMMLLSMADYIIVGVVVLSVLVSFFRGFVKEALSLMTWCAAIWLAVMYCTKLSTLLAAKIQMPSLRLMIAFAVIFLSILIAGAIVSFIVHSLVKKTGLSGTDRVLGVVFGLARGVLVIALVVMAASLTHLPQQPAWKSSILIPQFQVMANWLYHLLPTLNN